MKEECSTVEVAAAVEEQMEDPSMPKTYLADRCRHGTVNMSVNAMIYAFWILVDVKYRGKAHCQ